MGRIRGEDTVSPSWNGALPTEGHGDKQTAHTWSLPAKDDLLFTNSMNKILNFLSNYKIINMAQFKSVPWWIQGWNVEDAVGHACSHLHMQPHDVWHNLGLYEVVRHVNQILVSFCLNNVIKGRKRDVWRIWCMLQVYSWMSPLNYSIHRKGEQGWHRCSRCSLPPVVFYLATRGRHAPVNCDTESTGQLLNRNIGKIVTKHIQGVKSSCDRETFAQDQLFFLCPPVSQQDIRCKDQDHQRLPGWGGQLHSIPPSHASLRLPSDWPTRVHTRPSGLHADSDCGGQSFGRGWTIWGHVPGNRWDTHTSPPSCLWPAEGTRSLWVMFLLLEKWINVRLYLDPISCLRFQHSLTQMKVWFC